MQILRCFSFINDSQMLIPVPLKISEYARPRSLNHSPEAFLGYLNAKVRDVHLP